MRDDLSVSGYGFSSGRIAATLEAMTELFIDGLWCAAEGEQVFESRNPATGAHLADVAQAGVGDVDRAVRAARRAFDETSWGASSNARNRARVLIDAAASLRARVNDLAEMETLDSGKLLADSVADMEEAAFQLEYYGGWATKIGGDVPVTPDNALSIVVQEPVGVCALITPWNYPLLMATQKVGPALAAGCTVVLKPAEQTSLTAVELGRALAEAGCPAGVFNLVTGLGPEAGAALVDHPGIDKVSFTGSTAVGTAIGRSAADRQVRVSLELGGKSPNIVMADADLERAVAGSCTGVFFNQGQVCSAGSRVLVHRSIHDELLDAMVAAASAITLGDPMDEVNTMGPLVSAIQRERVERYIEVGAADDGARLVHQGAVPASEVLLGGYFVPPTIFADVDNAMTIAREEIFGPVMSVIPFDDEVEAIRIANDSPYGLAASIWTSDIATSITMARAIRAGTVWINESQPAPSEVPWGGFKRSGVGRELGVAGLESFLETKHIYISLD